MSIGSKAVHHVGLHKLWSSLAKRKTFGILALFDRDAHNLSQNELLTHWKAALDTYGHHICLFLSSVHSTFLKCCSCAFILPYVFENVFTINQPLLLKILDGGGKRGAFCSSAHRDPQKTLHSPKLHLYPRLPAHHQIGGAQNRAKSLLCFLDVCLAYVRLAPSSSLLNKHPVRLSK